MCTARAPNGFFRNVRPETRKASANLATEFRTSLKLAESVFVADEKAVLQRSKTSGFLVGTDRGAHGGIRQPEQPLVVTVANCLGKSFRWFPKSAF